MLTERIKILQEIEELNKQRCDLCTVPLNHLEATCECYAAVKVRELGHEMLNLTKPRNAHEFELLEKAGIENLTDNIYRLVKAEGLKEVEIAKALKVSPARLYNWRRENSLLGIRSVEV